MSDMEQTDLSCGCVIHAGLNEEGERTLYFVSCPAGEDCPSVKAFISLARAKTEEDPATTLVVKDGKVPR